MYLWTSQKFPLEQIFRHKVLKMLAGKGEDHTGYDHAAGQMATYRIQRILWATHFAPARKIHGNPGSVYYPSIFLPGTYELLSGNRPCGIPVQRREGNQVFDALEWLAAMPGGAKPCEDGCSHVPNKGEQMARYYGFYSNVARGKRKKNDADDKISCLNRN